MRRPDVHRASARQALLTRAALAAMLAAPLPALSPHAVLAATFVVTKTADTNDGTCDTDCSLREAVIAANAAAGADAVTLPAGTYTLGGAPGEDAAASGDLDLLDSISITGDGAATTIVDGGAVDRIFDVLGSGTITFSALTLRNGRAPEADFEGGGAIRAGAVPTLALTLDGVTVSGNSGGTSEGGGLWVFQDTPGTTTLTITDSTIAGNTTEEGDGGGIWLCCEQITAFITRTTISGNEAFDDPNISGTKGEGGGLYHCCANTTITITDSTISGNVGPRTGGGLYTCCGASSNTLLTVERSTVSGNTSLLDGYGGGIEAEGDTVLINSTVSGNRASLRGGGVYNDENLVLVNTTIAGNDAPQGAGLYNEGLSVTLRNALLAGNTGGANCQSIDPLVSEGGNLSSDASCVLGDPSDLEGMDPLLGPLAANGGPTLTHALLEGSPAVDAGTDVGCPLTDQRGQARPFDGDGDTTASCDIGSFELANVPEVCDNGIDDNLNGLIDCDDFDCVWNPLCPERCTNCIDDDGDGNVDREDADCPAPIDGAGAGVADGRGKLVMKCAKALQKRGGKLASTSLQKLQKCLGGLQDCVQKKPGDAACQNKVGARCTSDLARLETAVEKTAAGIEKSCSALSASELRDAAGVGFAGEEALCAELGVPALDDPGDVAACLTAQHRCAAEQMVGLEFPRGRELLTLGGIDAGTTLPCLFAPANGGGVGLGARGKTAAACQKAVGKAGGKLASGALKLEQKCATAVLSCHEQHPGDAACLTKAEKTCRKTLDKVVLSEESLVLKTRTTISKKCDVPTLTLAEVLGSTGLGFQAQAGLCRALGFPSLGSIDAISDCVTDQHLCRVEQLLERELPRQEELFRTGLGMP